MHGTKFMTMWMAFDKLVDDKETVKIDLKFEFNGQLRANIFKLDETVYLSLQYCFGDATHYLITGKVPKKLPLPVIGTI